MPVREGRARQLAALEFELPVADLGGAGVRLAQVADTVRLAELEARLRAAEVGVNM